MQITIISIFFSSIIVSTLAQGTGKNSIEGTIVFPVTDSIPQGVIIIPIHPDGLSNDVRGQWLYFDAMKWTQQELLWEITRCKKERVVVEGIDSQRFSLLYRGMNDCYITYGKVNLRLDNEPDEHVDLKEYSLNMYFGGSVHNIKYTTAPRSLGVPMSFECLDW